MKYISQNPFRFSVRVFRIPAPSTFPILRLRKWILDIALSNSLSSNDTFQGILTLHLHHLCRDPLKIWNPHLNSNHNIPHDARLRTNNYAIYPGTLNDTYIYEQSEYDALSTATFPLQCHRQHPNSKESCDAGKLFGGMSQETGYSSCIFKLCRSWIRGTSTFNYESNYYVHPPRLRTFS
jgi:hypothetical protein